MPDLTIIHIALLAIAMVVGAAVAWVLRGRQAEQEKAAVGAEWQKQVKAQRREHERLVDQNKGLMEQVSQYKAQHSDAKNRAKELSLAIQEAFQRRDELQREIKDIRGNLETALSERDQLASSVQAHSDDEDLLRRKDARIEKLTKELENWQNRLPPLIERFRLRNEEAQRFETALDEALDRIRELESERAAANETRIEPVERAEELTDGMDASNDDSDGADDPDDAYGAYDVDDPDEADDSVEEVGQVFDEALDEEDSADDSGDDDMPRNHRDDLQMIKGVGPAIEKTLNELGIFSFRQIADMSEYDIDRVARRLKGFHSRIHREDWIGQARALIEPAAHA